MSYIKDEMHVVIFGDMNRYLNLSIIIGLFWSAHQRFFRSLCIASKVDKAISLSKQALEDGHCCVIGLQTTGEARSKGAAAAAGFEADAGGDFDAFVSAPNEDLKRISELIAFLQTSLAASHSYCSLTNRSSQY